MAIKKVLILAANPLETPRLRLEKEVEEIRTTLQLSPNRDHFEIESRGAVSPQDLQQHLFNLKPQILHFSGHGGGDRGLAFEDEDGRAIAVSTEALADLFKLFASQIQCVVLNACYAEVQARAIAQYIPYVIGMNQAIGDEAARRFAEGFYRAIWDDRSIEEAFASGRTAIKLEGIPEELTPVLLTRTARNIDNSVANSNDVNLVQMDGRWYVVQTQIESRCHEELLKPGALIRIKSPDKMGKGSLKARLLQFAQNQGYRTVSVDLREANQETFVHINQFLLWLCAYVSDRLDIDADPEKTWKKILGANANCTKYVEKFLLEPDKAPLVLALTNFNHVFNYPHVENDFLGLLRGWFEKVNERKVWGRLRQIIVYSEEALATHNINQSPFNVGLSIELDELTPSQVLALAEAYGLSWSMSEVQHLMALVGGHPFLVDEALKYMHRGNNDLQALLATAATDEGIYRSYLHEKWRQLESDSALIDAMKKLAIADGAVRLERKELVKIDGMGLLKHQGNEVLPRCDLYKRYFSDRLK
ncbi:MAG: AAA-like domain-containing protein [Pseudanabaena sp. ELA748]